MVGIVWFFGKSLIVDASLLSEAERLARIAGVIGEPRKPGRRRRFRTVRWAIGLLAAYCDRNCP